MKPSNKKKTTKVQGLRACEPFPEVAMRASKVMRRVPQPRESTNTQNKTVRTRRP
jgi:hypothetical protein